MQRYYFSKVFFLLRIFNFLQGCCCCNYFNSHFSKSCQYCRNDRIHNYYIWVITFDFEGLLLPSLFYYRVVFYSEAKKRSVLKNEVKQVFLLLFNCLFS